MQGAEEFWLNTKKRDHVRVLADMAHTILKSNYFLRLHDSNIALKQYSKAVQWHKIG